MARRTSLLRCLLAYPLLGLSGVLWAQEIPGGTPPGVTLDDDAEEDPFALAVLNYDASTFLTNGSTKDGSNNVTLLKNLGTGGDTYDMAVVAGTPLWTDDGMGTGLDSIDFEAGDTDWLAVNATPVTAAPMHWFVVLNVESTGARVVAYLGDKDVDGDDMWRLGIATAAPVYGATDSGEAAATHGATLSTATTYLLEGRSTSATDRAVNVDDGTEATNATDKTPDNADRVAIGIQADSVPNRAWDGMVGQVLLYDSVQTGATRDAIIAALDAKWSIPGVSSSPPLGPSGPSPWPPVLLAIGAALLVGSLRRSRRPAGQVIQWPAYEARNRAAA